MSFGSYDLVSLAETRENVSILRGEDQYRSPQPTERSESVSEEAEEQLSLHVILDELVQHITHPE